MFNECFRNQMKKTDHFLHPQFLLLKSFCLRSNIKYFDTAFSSLDETPQSLLKNTWQQVIFFNSPLF